MPDKLDEWKQRCGSGTLGAAVSAAVAAAKSACGDSGDVRTALARPAESGDRNA
jgi:hypothetical protein